MTHNDKEEQMTEFTITGIRFQMGDHLSFDEATEAAKQFVAGIKKGQQVMLVAEPENPIDQNAIAAYINYERIGYIDKEETEELLPLLDENHQCDAIVERTDGHVTFFISIPGATEKLKTRGSRHRVLPESPLGDSVYMSYTKAESKLQLIASRLSGIDINKDNLQEIICLAEHYVELLKISICHDDSLWMNKIAKKMHKICSLRQELGMTEAELEKVSFIYNKVHEAVGDMHCTVEHWPERVFVEHLERLRKDESVNRHLYKKYCDAYLGGKDFSEADKTIVAEEHQRLYDWLKSMKWSELRNPKDLQAMGLKVNYLKLSRRELYDLYSVLLLVEKLEPQQGTTDCQNDIVMQLKPIFFGNEQEAKDFYDAIQGMKPKQITERVNQLVAERKISGLSKHRPLWTVLHNCGLYTKSESNWNQQVK